MEILSRSSVRTISLYDLGENNTSGDRRPRISRANIGVKRDKGMSSDQDAIHERVGVGLAGAELSICLPHRAGTIKPASSHLRQG